MRHLLLFLALLLSETLFAQLPFKIISDPQYRIINKKEYYSNDLGLPEELNDSTATLFCETTYTYSDDRLVLRKKKWKEDEYMNLHEDDQTDSIVYHSADSISVFHKNNGKYGREWPYRLSDRDFVSLLGKILSTEGQYRPEPGYWTYTFSADHGFLRTIEEQRPYALHTETFIYENNRPKKVFGVMEGRNYDTADTYTYYDPKHFAVSSSAVGGIWCCTFHYYFDDRGYLIRYAVESDTNPHITVYEYEKGKGNAVFFENSFHNVTGLRPFIY